jgi:PAS domain S-box-containing protein
MANRAVLRFTTALIHYLGASLCVALAYTLGSWLALHYISAAASMLLCAIVLSAWVGGIGPGVWAVALSLLCFDYGFVIPLHSLRVDPQDLPRMLIFSSTAIFIGGLGALQHRTARSLRQMHDTLADTIKMLTGTNLALQWENTQHLRVAAQLRLSEAFLAEGEQISHTGSWRWHIASHTLMWSDEHHRIFGCVPDCKQPDIDAIRQRIHPDDLAALGASVRHAIETGSPFQCEYRIVLPSGAVRHVCGTGRPLAYENGRVTEYIGSTVDVTARRRTEDRLRESEKAFRTLAENSPDAIVRYNRRCERIYVNPAFERNRGIRADEVLNAPLDTGWASDLPIDEYRAVIRRVLESGAPQRVAGTWSTPQYGREYFQVHLVAERDAGGEIVSVLALSRNLTEVKEAQLRIEESRRLIRQLAGRSEAAREDERKHQARELHDGLSQSLLALRMQIGVLGIEFAEVAPALTSRVDTMKRHVDEMIAAVRNTVASLRPPVLDLGIVPALEWLVDACVAEAGVACKFDSALEQVELDEPHTMALFRIAQEALRNIVRHARASHVHVQFRQAGSGYLLEIRDDGIGFDPSTRKPMSFGLVGIRERVLMCGGTFDLASLPGAGTALRVSIPASTRREQP